MEISHGKMGFLTFFIDNLMKRSVLNQSFAFEKFRHLVKNSVFNQSLDLTKILKFSQKNPKFKGSKSLRFLTKCRNFSSKSKLWLKTGFFTKCRNFWSKSKLWLKTGFFTNCGKFWSKSKLWLKLKILVEFWSKIEILVKTGNFGRILVKNDKNSITRSNFYVKLFQTVSCEGSKTSSFSEVHLRRNCEIGHGADWRCFGMRGHSSRSLIGSDSISIKLIGTYPFWLLFILASYQFSSILRIRTKFCPLLKES